MKGKIKILSLVMAVAMVSSLFAACKSNEPADTSSTTGTTTESSTATEPEAPEEVVEISWYYGGDRPKQPDAVIEALNKKSAEDIGVKVNFKFTTGDDKTIKAAVGSGDKDLDIVFACAWFNEYIVNAQKNGFMDITTLLPEKAPDLFKDYPEKLWDGVKVNGKIYGVPVWKDSAAQQFWIARKDILLAAGAEAEFSKAGLAVSTLTPTLEKIKAWHDADPAKNAYSEGNTAPINFNKVGLNGHDNMWDTMNGETRIGIRVKEGNKTVQSYYTDPDYIADLKTLKEWADKGLSNGKLAPTVEQEYPLLTIGTAQGWDGAQYGSWGGPIKGYDSLVQPKTQPILTSATAQGAMNCIGANSTKVDASLKYLEYVATNAEYRNMLQYGIEGTNWHMAVAEDIDKYYAETLKAGGVTEADVKAYKDSALGKVIQQDTGDAWAPWGFAAGSWKHLLPVVGASPDMYVNIMGLLETATPSDLLGFAPNIENIKTEQATCAKVVKDTADALQCGAVKDVDATIAKLLKDLDKLGYQKLITEFQAQVDAFLAK